MDVAFADTQLQLVETHHAAETLLPVAVIETMRRRLSIIRAAPNAETLRKWRSSGLSCACENLEGVHTISINESWRMTVLIEGADNSARTTVLEVTNQPIARGADND